jgi:predicted dehydrogenase
MRVLIVGLGSIGEKHFHVLKEILAYVDVFAIRSSQNAEIYDGITNIFSFNEINDLNIDFIIISNPSSLHLETVNKLIKYKLPLFIEKPLFSSLDYKDVIKKINKEKIFTYVACNLRFLDCIKFVNEKLSKGTSEKLNEVNVYCGSYLPDWRSEIDFKKTYSSNSKLGGGVHLDLIHELDYLYWIFGKPKNIFRRFRNQSSLNINSYDYANYLLDYSKFSANIILNYFRRDAKRSFELVFENETWIVNLLENNIKKNNKIIFSSDQSINDTYKSQMSYFIKSLQNIKNESMNSVNDACEVLKICLEK